MTTEELRFEIPEPKHQPIACPNRGHVMGLPYVSHAAFAAYLGRREDPKAAFLALAEHSIEGGLPPGELTEEDCDAIARFYAGTMECAEEYDKAKAEQGVYRALQTAFTSTSLWKSYLEDVRRYSTQFSPPPFIEDVSRQMAALQDTLRAFSRSTLPDHIFKAPVIELPVQTALLDMRSLGLLPRIDAIAGLAALATRNLDAWQGMLKHHNRFAEAARAFAERTQWMSQVADQVGQMKRLLDPVSDITRMLRAAGEQMKNAGLVAGALADVDTAIARSVGVVVGTNDYFSRRGGLVSPVVRPSLPLDASPEEREAFVTVAESAFNAEGLMHEEASGLVLVGGEAAQLIENLVARQIDERLQPYGNILGRLERLSKAGTFLELLSTFAAVTAREYWKALWQKPGEAYLPSPERLAQTFLGLFLHGHWSGLGFVGREIGNGDGFVDLLVNFLGQDHVVELKMLGAGWGIGHAKGGLDQLDAYMQNYQCPEAFLVVFDGRKTQQGEQMKEVYQMPHGRVQVVVVRVYFDAPSR